MATASPAAFRCAARKPFNRPKCATENPMDGLNYNSLRSLGQALHVRNDSRTAGLRTLAGLLTLPRVLRRLSLRAQKAGLIAPTDAS
jgi:hypothetical protein